MLILDVGWLHLWYALGPVYTGLDKFLHGRILFLDRLFTWIRANSVAVVFTWVQSRQPGKNMTRFQALSVLSEQKVARFGCLHESLRNRNRAGQKVDLLFSGPKLALTRSKIRPVPPVPCKRKVEPCRFLSVQKFVRTRVNGALMWLCDIVMSHMCQSSI